MIMRRLAPRAGGGERSRRSISVRSSRPMEMERWLSTEERTAGGLLGRGGICWRARIGETDGVGGEGLSISRYHGMDCVSDCDSGASEISDTCEDSLTALSGFSDCIDSNRRAVVCIVRDKLVDLGRGRRFGRGLLRETPARDVKASRSEWRHA